MSVDSSSEHLSIESRDRYRNGRMAAEELLAAGDHLASCQSCRDSGSSEEREEAVLNVVRSKLQAAAEQHEHLSFDQIAAYVEGTLTPPEQQIVDSDLQSCLLCNEEVADLARFRTGQRSISSLDEARVRRSRWFPASLAAAAVVAVIAAATMVTFRRAPTFEPTATSPAAPPGKQPSLLTLKDSGRSIELMEGGAISGLESLPPDEQVAIRQTLIRRTVEIPASIAALVGQPGTLMGASSETVPFELLAPVGTVIREDRPLFRWKPLARARSYVVAVFDPDLNRIARSIRLAETSWRPDRPLQRGRTYSWQVTATAGGKEVVSPVPPAPEARFAVLDRDTASAIEAANAREGEGHLSRAVRYARAGMLDDAEKELEALHAENPESEVAQKLVESVRASRARLPEATRSGQRESPTTTKPAQ